MWHKGPRQCIRFKKNLKTIQSVWGKGRYVFVVINSLLPPLSKKFKTCHVYLDINSCTNAKMKCKKKLY